jgi:hypothetical protein
MRVRAGGGEATEEVVGERGGHGCGWMIGRAKGGRASGVVIAGRAVTPPVVDGVDDPIVST